MIALLLNWATPPQSHTDELSHCIGELNATASCPPQMKSPGQHCNRPGLTLANEKAPNLSRVVLSRSVRRESTRRLMVRALGGPYAPPTSQVGFQEPQYFLGIPRPCASRAQTGNEPLLPMDQASRIGDVLLNTTEVVFVGHARHKRGCIVTMTRSIWTFPRTPS
jgi:hypothetical protein